MPISIDLRKRIVAAYQRGEGTYAEIAQRFCVGEATVSRLLRREREDKTVAPRPHGGGRRRTLSVVEEKQLAKLVLAQPDKTEQEFATELAAELGRAIGRLVVGRTLRRMGYRVKKSPLSPTNKRGPTSPKNDAPGLPDNPNSTLRVLFSWTRPVSTRQ